MNAQQRIARANRLDAARNGQPTAHCLDCGQLHCEGHEPSIPAQRVPEPSMDTLAERLAWEQAARA